jgi:ribosomal-protein-alanine N-acetyltransferase
MEADIRELRFDDLDQIVEIEKKCFSMPWSKSAFSNELLNKWAYYQCALIDNNIVGYMGMWKILDEGHITNVAVLPEYRKRGIASLLIKKMIEICICSEIENMTLEARESNFEAIRLYEKFGFIAVGKRPNYYQRPDEAAVIMWKKIN